MLVVMTAKLYTVALVCLWQYHGNDQQPRRRYMDKYYLGGM